MVRQWKLYFLSLSYKKFYLFTIFIHCLLFLILHNIVTIHVAVCLDFYVLKDTITCTKSTSLKRALGQKKCRLSCNLKYKMLFILPNMLHCKE